LWPLAKQQDKWSSTVGVERKRIAGLLQFSGCRSAGSVQCNANSSLTAVQGGTIKSGPLVTASRNSVVAVSSGQIVFVSIFPLFFSVIFFAPHTRRVHAV